MTDATMSGTVLSPSYAPATTGAPALGPVRPAERVELLDVLRGFALFGILQTNFSAWGGVLGKLIEFFIDGSFYTLYSFLFGLGFAIQMLRADEAGRPFALRYAWRSTVLFAIGAMHMLFIWPGDILHIYAPLSIVLLPIRTLRTWMLLVASGVLCVIFLVRVDTPVTFSSLLYRPTPETVDSTHVTTNLEIQRLMASRQSMANGAQGGDIDLPYGERVRGRAESLTAAMTRPEVFDQWFRVWGDIFFMFILGLLCGRKRILHEPASHRRLLTGIALGGGWIGVIGNFYDTFSEFADAHGLAPSWLSSDVSWLTYSGGNIGLALFYLSGLTLLFTFHARARRFLAPLAYAGRMGLTNYLMQSVVFTFIVWGPVLHLDDTLGHWEQQLVLVAFFLVQLLYSRWWFKRFQYGPVEWAWRSLTWFRLQPMRVTGTRPAEVGG